MAGLVDCVLTRGDLLSLLGDQDAAASLAAQGLRGTRQHFRQGIVVAASGVGSIALPAPSNAQVGMLAFADVSYSLERVLTFNLTGGQFSLAEVKSVSGPLKPAGMWYPIPSLSQLTFAWSNPSAAFSVIANVSAMLYMMSSSVYGAIVSLVGDVYTAAGVS